LTPLALALLAAVASTGLPSSEGLPVRVNAAVNFVDVIALDENAQTFKATIDVRLRWRDGRLVYPAAETPSGFKEAKDDAAAAALSEMWAPEVAIANQEGDASNVHTSLRIFPDGRAELFRRSTASFGITLDAAKFPFDQQDLVVDLASSREPASRVALVFDQSDLTLSQVGRHEKVDGWNVGAVDVRRGGEIGWYGTTHAHVRVSLRVARDPKATIAPIFIPLLAALLIPIIALWLNEAQEDGFKVEAFELTNVLIGGLFALIALNFTVNSSYTILAGDNPISRLFAINYILLGVGLVINLAMFRYNVVGRKFGKHVNYEAFSVVTWALPSLVVVAVVWILAVAAA
jgi:hypothetical protein